MTVLFHDIHNDPILQEELKEDRILGAILDEVLYADDTIIHSTSPEQLQQLLNEIEQEGLKYGLKLNHKKCETMTIRDKTLGHSEIKFADGTTLQQLNESKYLGCFLNHKTDPKREFNKRKGDVFYTWKKLETFWKHTNCSLEFKLIAYDAVIRAKLMYG